MPSEDHADRALAQLAPAGETFQSAVARAVEEVRGFLSAHPAPAADRAGAVAAELGAFGSGRIDPERFSELFEETGQVDAGARGRAQQALDVLTDIHRRGSDIFRLRVEPGTDLRNEVGRALAEAGRAFGAAHMLEFARNGSAAGDAPRLAKTYPFRSWNRAERAIAPPLVVEVGGSDVQAAGLVEFLDGGQKIVLVVDGACPPAPLARLISPGSFVMQTDDAEALSRLADAEAPGIAALMPAEAARFVHDPAAGETLGARLAVTHLPDEETVRTLGSMTVRQQMEDLRQLAELVAAATPAEVAAPAGALAAAVASGAAAPEASLPEAAAGLTAPEAATAGPGPTPSADDRAGRLAGWLLQQADLSDLG